MRFKGRRQSQNIEDRRASRGGRTAVGGGIGTIVLVLLVLMLGGDPSQLLSQAATSSGPSQSRALTAEDQEWKEYVSVVLADTEEVWNKLFAAQGADYREPKLVLFRDSVQSACGYASAQVGPFYCGADETVYIDTGFFQELRSRFRVSGDFAPAYVIAHEVGHHVQKLTGRLDEVNQARERLPEREANAMLVRLELQADFYAGVWAHHAKRMAAIDESDIREAMEATQAVGDDTLQKQAQGYVVPDAFTHGTSEQRTRWFLKGWQSGDPSQGDTFNTRRL